MKHSIKASVLDNGLGLHLINVADAHMVELRLFFEAGFEYFDKDTFHVPHLLEHLLLDNGSVYETEEEMLRALQTMGAQCNASTDYEHLTVMLRAPANNFLKALDIVLRSVFQAHLTQETLNRERDIVLRELAEQYDGLGDKMVSEILSHRFPDLVPSDWTHHLDRTSAIDLETLRTAYDRYITPKGAKVIAAGTFDSAMQQQLKRMLGNIPHGASTQQTPAKVELTPGPLSIQPLAIDLDTDASQVYTFTSRISQSESHESRAACNFAAQLLLLAPTAIIPLRLREKGLVYSVTAENFQLTDWFIIVIHVSTAADKADLAALDILKYLQLYGNGYIDDDEMHSVKQFLINNLPVATETIGDLVDWYSSDILRDRPMTSVELESNVIKRLSKSEVAAAIKLMFLDASVDGLVASKDAGYWVEELATINLATDKNISANSIHDSFASLQDKIASKRSLIPERIGGSWAIYWLLMFASWIIALWSSYLPVKGMGGTVSLVDFAWDINMAWGVAFFLPFTLAGILTWVRGAKEQLAEQLAIVLNFITALIYVYCVYYFFGDIGVDEQPWYEDVSGIVHLAFFYIAAPLAFVSVVRQQIRSWRSKQQP